MKNCTTHRHRFCPRLLVGLFSLVVGMASLHAQCTDPAACNYDPGFEPSPYALVVDLIHEDIGLLVGQLGAVDLTGYSTTRVYFETDNPNDFLSSVFGDSEYPTVFETTTSFYHALLGGATPNGINGLLFPVYPDLAYDSWVTIGIEGVPDAALGEAAVSTVQGMGQPWLTTFEPGAGAPGGNIVINDDIGGAWFNLAGEANGVPDEQGRVLLGQFTTDGSISGNLHLQIFPNGDQSNFIPWNGVVGASTSEDCQYLSTYYVDNDGDGYGTDPVELCALEEGYAELPGDCNDNSAIAYPGNPADIVGDGIDGDCDGGETCYRDIDADGYRNSDETDLIGSPFNINCSEFGEAYGYQPIDCDDTNPALQEADEDGNCLEVISENFGCGDPGACNYDPDAIPDEANCEYLSCQGCGNPSACNYDPGSPIFNPALCDFSSCAGCTDPDATNYNPDAVIADDGACIFFGALAIAPVSVQYNGADSAYYTNEVYALLPPDAIQLIQVLGVKEGDTRLRIDPYEDFYQSSSCPGWAPGLGQQVSVDVDGVTYVNPSCLLDSWFTIGGSVMGGPALTPIGFDPATVEGQGAFDSELLAAAGDTLGWTLADPDAGVPQNHCGALSGRPGCANAVRIARFTLPMGKPFFMEAGLTYMVSGEEGRSTSEGVLETSGSSVQSDGGGGGEADSDDALIVDGGTSNIVYGCLDAMACNFDPLANSDSGACDYASCMGCTYPEAENYDETKTVDDGSCLFEGCTDPNYLEFDANANEDDGSCTTPLISGCVDPGFLEFDAAANVADAGSCLTAAVAGCTYPDAQNFNIAANVEDGSCLYGGCTDPAYLNFDDGADVDDGSCSELVIAGCTDPAYIDFDPAANVLDASACVTGVIEGCTYSGADNYAPAANSENGTCTFSMGSDCPADFTGDGAVGAADLLDFLSVFDTNCE